MKSYKDFMNIRKEIKKFADVVSYAVQDLDLDTSYTKVRSREEQPDADFLEIHTHVLKTYTEEQILDLITRLGGKESFIDAIEDVGGIDNIGKDVYYYFLTKSNKVKIGAYWNLDSEPWEYDADPYVKYVYGDHHSNYGILLIQQNYGTVEHFLETIPKQFVYYLFSIQGLSIDLGKMGVDRETLREMGRSESPEIKISGNELEIDFKTIYDKYINNVEIEHYYSIIEDTLSDADEDYSLLNRETLIYKRKFE